MCRVTKETGIIAPLFFRKTSPFRPAAPVTGMRRRQTQLTPRRVTGVVAPMVSPFSGPLRQEKIRAPGTFRQGCVLQACVAPICDSCTKAGANAGGPT